MLSNLIEHILGVPSSDRAFKDDDDLTNDYDDLTNDFIRRPRGKNEALF